MKSNMPSPARGEGRWIALGSLLLLSILTAVYLSRKLRKSNDSKSKEETKKPDATQETLNDELPKDRSEKNSSNDLGKSKKTETVTAPKLAPESSLVNIQNSAEISEKTHVHDHTQNQNSKNSNELQSETITEKISENVMQAVNAGISMRSEQQKDSVSIGSHLSHSEKNVSSNPAQHEDIISTESQLSRSEGSSVCKPSEHEGITSKQNEMLHLDNKSLKNQTVPLTELGQMNQTKMAVSAEPDSRKMNGTRSSTNANQNSTIASSEEERTDTRKLTTEEITDALLISQNSPGMMSAQNAEVLVALLIHVDPDLQISALTGVNKCSTFIRNQNLLREHGCLSQLTLLLRRHTQEVTSMSQNASESLPESASGGEEDKSKGPRKMSNSMSAKFMNLLATAINNLSNNEQNQKQFEECVPMLVDIALEEETGESVRLSSLQALTNLSVMEDHHNHYTRIIQKLYNFVDTQTPGIRLQAAKILVNLSCNPALVPHMLAAKAPSCLLELLRTGSDEALVLRWTTFLANILQTVKDSNISASSLPTDDKAPSPETMYSALYGMNSIGQIKSKVFLLCRHRNEDIKLQASRIYQTLNSK